MRTSAGVIFMAGIVWSCTTTGSTVTGDEDGGQQADASVEASTDSGGPETGVDDDGGDTGDSGDSGDAQVDAADGGPIGPMCKVACAVGEKWCSDRCVAIDDPLFGCGATTCKPACAITVPHTRGRTTCAAGACLPGGATPACKPGWGNCDGDWANGCEADLSTRATCGTCTNACATGQVCDNGTCAAACTPPRDDCGTGACHDFATSPTGCNCNVCPDGNGTATCSAGTCGLTCDTGFGKCAGSNECFDIMNDPNHCGASCVSCSTAVGELWPEFQRKACNAGACAATCWEGYTSCSYNSSISYCADLKGDPEHCGGCDVKCAASETCTTGVCTPKTSAQFVTGFIAPADLAVDANNLYVADSGGPGKVWKIEKATLTKTQIATLQPGVSSIAVDSTHVYWASTTGVYRAPIAGGTPVLLYSGTGPIAVDNTSVYYMDAVPTIWKAPKAGGGIPTSLATGRKSLRLKSINGVLYGWWYGNGYRQPDSFFGIDETTSAVTVDDSRPGAMANWYGGHTTDGTIHYMVHESTPSAMLQKDRLDGHPTERYLFASRNMWYDVTSEIDPWGCGVYLGTTAGIWRVNLDHDVPFRITSAVEALKRIAFDEKYLYWADSTWIGRLEK